MPHAANHSPHRAPVIDAHLVRNPPDRKKVLTGTAAAGWKEPLAATATQHGFEIQAVEVMPDHVDLLVRAPPKFVPAEIIGPFKGITSRRPKKELESLRRGYRGRRGGPRARGTYLAVHPGNPADIVSRPGRYLFSVPKSVQQVHPV